MLKAAKIQNVAPIPIAPEMLPKDDATTNVKQGFIAPNFEITASDVTFKILFLTSNWTHNCVDIFRVKFSHQ